MVHNKLGGTKFREQFREASLQRMLLALVLVITAIAKYLYNEPHSHSHASESLGTFLRHPGLQQTVATLELALAITLMSRYWLVAMYGVLAMVTGFWALLILMSIRGESVSQCGCMGAIEMGRTSHFILIIGMFLLALSAIFPKSTDESSLLEGGLP